MTNGTKITLTKKEPTLNEGSIRSEVVAAIRKAGARGADRTKLIEKFDGAANALVYLKKRGYIKETNGAAPARKAKAKQ